MEKKKSKPKTSGKATKNVGANEGRDNQGRQKKVNKGQFKKNNKAAEKWTEATVLEKMEAVWKTLTTDENGNPPIDKNVVRANDIKYLYEALLIHDITKQQWNEWKDKFGPTDKNSDNGSDKNPLYSPAVSDLYNKIKMLLECRLSYSGTSMDVFHLKNHYDYKDQSQVDTTTNGESLNNPFYELLKLTSVSNSRAK